MRRCLTIAAAAWLLLPSLAAGQDEHEMPTPTEMPLLYVHATVGGGMAFMNSEDVESAVEGFSVAWGAPLSMGLRVGYSRFVQLEYRRIDSDHHFSQIHGFQNGELRRTTIEMDFDISEWSVKGSPVRLGDYLVYALAGRGTVDWRDEDDSGFAGRTRMLGIEFARPLWGRSRSMSGTLPVSLRRYNISFDRVMLEGRTARVHELRAVNYAIEASIGVGPGWYRPPAVDARR